MWNMEQPTSDLIERLKQLEHQQVQLQRAHRRLKLMTGGVALVAGALVLMAQAAPPQIKSVEAQEFVLMGSDGKVRGAMGITSDGAVGLNFNDASGQTRVTLDLAANGSPGLDFYDQTGKERATFALGPAGTPGLGLYDPSGKLRTSLDIPAHETPGLAFYHSDGRPGWGAP